jgi:tripartite-type tricarboxylate transporter receptor subunit TctC
MKDRPYFPMSGCCRVILHRLLTGLTGHAMVLLLSACHIALACAQFYPARTVRVIVPIAAGGVNDIMARAISQKLSQSLGQPVVVENRPGGNTIIGAEVVARSAADGYTLLFTPGGTIVDNPFLYDKLPYDPVKDFVPVAMCCVIAQAIIVHPSVKADSLQELITLARSQPGKLSYASTGGSGSSSHINMEALKHLAKIDVLHVPYKGSAQAITDLVAGRVSMMVVIFGVVQDHLRAGTLKALAVGSTNRSSMFPDIPTAAEAGIPGFDASGWIGLFAPKGIPRDIVSKLSTEIRKIIANPQFGEQWIRTLGIEPPVVDTPERFAEFIRADMKRAEHLIRVSGAKVD